jgi:hypothetical protein
LIKSICFKIASDGRERFSHFIHDSGIIAAVDKDAEIAKICVVANSIEEVTEEQREAILKLAFFAARDNHLVSITYGCGLSPFFGGAIQVPDPTNALQGGAIDCIHAD